MHVATDAGYLRDRFELLAAVTTHSSFSPSRVWDWGCMCRSGPTNSCSRVVARSAWGTVTDADTVLVSGRIRLRSGMMWCMLRRYTPEHRFGSFHFSASPGLVRRYSDAAPRSAAVASGCASVERLEAGAIRGHSRAGATTEPPPFLHPRNAQASTNPPPNLHRSSTGARSPRAWIRESSGARFSSNYEENRALAMAGSRAQGRASACNTPRNPPLILHPWTDNSAYRPTPLFLLSLGRWGERPADSTS